MSKHTKGPWRTSRTNGKISAITDADGREICWGYHEDFGALIDPIKPSVARLLSKAWLLPEMVEALEEAIAVIDGGGCLSDEARTVLVKYEAE